MEDGMPFVPLNKLPQINTATVLIVGAEGVGKHEFSKALVETKTPFSLQVRTATGLPLPHQNADSRPRIDFVIFMVDLTCRRSFFAVKESLGKLDVRYFLGQVCFVVTGANKWEESSIDVDGITQLADSYDSPIFFLNLQDREDKEGFAAKVLSLVQTAAGFRPSTSPLLVDTTRRPQLFERL